MRKRIAIFGLVFIFLIWCGCNQLTNFFKCDFDGYLTDRKIRNEFYNALATFEQQHGLTFEASGPPACASSGFELFLTYNTPQDLSMYNVIYSMNFWVTYSRSSKTIILQYGDYAKNDLQDGLIFIDSFRESLIDFESTAKVRELVDQFRYRLLHGSVWSDRIEISTTGAPAPSLDSGGYASIQYSITRGSIQSYNLPNHLTWSEFSEMTSAHQIILEQYLTGGLAGCSIATDPTRYANTNVIYLTDGSIRLDVIIFCPDNGIDGTLRLNLLPDGTFEYGNFSIIY